MMRRRRVPSNIPLRRGFRIRPSGSDLPPGAPPPRRDFDIDELIASPWIGLHYRHEFLLHHRHELLEESVE